MTFHSHGGNAALKIYKTPSMVPSRRNGPLFVDNGEKSRPFGEMYTTTTSKSENHSHGRYLWC